MFAYPNRHSLILDESLFLETVSAPQRNNFAIESLGLRSHQKMRCAPDPRTSELGSCNLLQDTFPVKGQTVDNFGLPGREAKFSDCSH